MNSRKKQKKGKKLKNKLKKKKSTYLGNLFLYLFVLLTIPLFGESAINGLQSGISWVDEKVFNRTIKKLEVEKINQNIILTTDDSKINFQRSLEQKKIAKAKDTDALEKIIEDSIKDEKKIKALVAEDTKNVNNLSEVESDKNITYMQILQKPNDLELNLKYARQQGKMGNYKQTIATLERLVILYPDNADLKFYLLSILIKADSPDKALGIIEEMKNLSDLSPEDLASIIEIETELKDRGEPKLWSFFADMGLGGLFNQNVNSVSKTRTKHSSGAVDDFNSAMFDNVYSGSMGFTAIRSIGESSSMMANLSGTSSRQDVDTTDNFESLGFTLAYDTSIGKHLISPYAMVSKTSYETDATNRGLILGFGNYYTINDSHALNYSYSYADSKNNQNSGHLTADNTDTISQSVSIGYDFTLNELVSASAGLGYGDSNAKEDTNDYENYDLDLRVNFALPFAYISIGNLTSMVDYSLIDSSLNPNLLRSDLTNTSDIMITKAIGDFLPIIDPNKDFFITLSYEKVISESNILNYDYVGESFSIGFNKAVQFNK